MKLNHIHLKAKDVKRTRRFYEEYFGFRFAFQKEETLQFLVDDHGCLVAIGQYAADQSPDLFPKWFHFGFCLDNPLAVVSLYERMKDDGVRFDRELSSKDGEWTNFYCLDPDGTKVEVSWNKGEPEKIQQALRLKEATRG